MSDGTLDAEYSMRYSVKEEITEFCIKNNIDIPVLDKRLDSQKLFKILREIKSLYKNS